MSMNGFANFVAPTPPGQFNFDMKSSSQSRSNAVHTSMSINKTYVAPQKGSMNQSVSRYLKSPHTMDLSRSLINPRPYWPPSGIGRDREV